MVAEDTLFLIYRSVAQLVARTAGGREVAGSSPVTPTRQYYIYYVQLVRSTDVGLSLRPRFHTLLKMTQ